MPPRLGLRMSVPSNGLYFSQFVTKEYQVMLLTPVRKELS